MIFLVGLVVVAALGYMQSKEQPTLSIPTATPTLQPTSSETLEFVFSGSSLRAAWVRVRDPQKIILYPNFTEKLSAKDAREEKNCASIVNGGFYTMQNSPIGLFVTEGEKMSDTHKNRLFNGFFSVDYEGNARISYDVPQNGVRFALQSGPLLLQNGVIEKLSIRNDELARRVVVAQEEDGRVFFIVLFVAGSPNLGPYLAELPEVLAVVGDKIEVRFTDALNLDGGSASAFLSDGWGIAEFAPIGSYFCVRE